MANYTKTTNFTSKDSLSTGNALKIIRGSEHDTEYSNIATAIQTKADLASPALTGTATAVNITVSGNLLVGSDTVTTNTATQTVTNKTIAVLKEVITVSATAATGTINYDAATQSVLYYTTNASGNFTVNFRASSGTTLNTLMATGESMSFSFLATDGSTAYYNSAVTVDGNSVTPKWQGGTAPTSGNASSVDVYNYVVIKTGSAAFTVLASQTKFA
jgi:hypothetical protein